MNLTDARRAGEELDRALAGSDPETIARCAAMNIWPLYTDQPEVLAATIAELPSRILERYPMLCVLHPMPPVLARAARLFGPADLAVLDVRSSEETDFLYLAQMIAFRLNGDVEAALESSRKLNDSIREQHLRAHERLDGPLWYFRHQIGSTLLAAGDAGAALVEFQEARRLAALSLQRDAERMALSGVALAHALRGEHDDVRCALVGARRLAAPGLPHGSSITSSETAAAALLAVDQAAGDGRDGGRDDGRGGGWAGGPARGPGDLGDDIDADLAAMEPFDSAEPSWPFALLARCRAYLMREEAEHALEAIQLAAGAHSVRPGSFAADVIGAMSLQVLLSSGDLIRARRLADGPASDGVLTRLAIARLSLQDGRLDVAAQELLSLATDQRVGPAQHAESAILAGWLEYCRRGQITAETVDRFARAAHREDGSRHLTGLPRQLLDEVGARLPPGQASVFARLTAGLATVEMVARPRLTVVELRILNALPVYPSIGDIATAFDRSPNTVKSQLRTVYRKLGCSTRDDAIRIAMRLRLLGADPEP